MMVKLLNLFPGKGMRTNRNIYREQLNFSSRGRLEFCRFLVLILI